MNHLKQHKAQVATEYLIMAGIVLGGALVIFYYTMAYSSESISINKASESAEIVAKAVDYVYALGPGTQTVVDIDLPSNVIYSYVESYEVGFRVSTSGGKSDVYSITKVNVTGGLPTVQGRHRILVNYTETGVVVGLL